MRTIRNYKRILHGSTTDTSSRDNSTQPLQRHEMHQPAQKRANGLRSSRDNFNRAQARWPPALACPLQRDCWRFSVVLDRKGQMTPTSKGPATSGRWRQLVLGVIAMMAISSPQYIWTLFVKPLQATTGASLPAIQVTITVLIVLQTWLSPLQGFLIERIGPRLLITIGAGLSGLSWVLAAQATSLVALYLTYGLFAGIGTGFVYIGVVGLMVQWFPDRRGFATGMVAAGYGFGAILTTFPINDMLASSGYQRTLILFGIILGAAGMLAGWYLRPPPAGAVLPAP